jgi:hypothetical protein
MDIKRELGAGKGANDEVARDMASFAVDGGLLLLGVDEAESPPALYPIPLAGLPERVEHVALTRIDEPLAVRTTAIPSVTNSADGYLAIRIPPSALAPHMVGGRYWGRGDKTKYQLPDDEVVRLHERRYRWERTGLEVLREQVERDPTPARTQAHLFLVAEPIAARDRMVVPLIEPPGDHFQRRILDFVHRAVGHAPPVDFSPSVDGTSATDRRGDAWALTTHSFERGRVVHPDRHESVILELEISERGTIRLFSGRGSDTLRERRVVFEVGTAGVCHQVLAVARQIGEEAGYWGSWNLGLAMTGTRGVISYALVEHRMFDENVPVFPDDGYESATRATLEEMTARPNDVVDRLIGRLIRSLGSREVREVKQLLD